MKKICLLLAVILMLAGIPAMAAEGDAMLGISEEEPLMISYSFSVGDTLYLVGSYGNFYSYRVGDADLTEYFIDIPQELMSGENSLEYYSLPFAADGQLYSLNLITEYSEYSDFKGATLTKLTLNGDGSASSEAVCDVDWNDYVEFYENNSYAIQPDIILGFGGKAFARYNDDQGDYRTMCIDLASGTTQEIDDLVNAYTIAPYKDGMILAEIYDPEVDSKARIVGYNPDDQSLQTLGEIDLADSFALVGLAYDSATDTLYCVNSGEICPVDLQAGVVGEGVTDMPLEAYSAVPGCILDGGYYAFGSSGVAIRNLDPAQKAQTKLKINDCFWSDSVNSAYYRFANAHGDVNVVVSREYTEIENLIENMMNREDRIDVYVLYTSSSMYEALYNRGYLMELDSNEKVKALADSMYPAIRDSLSTDGHLVALPVSMYGLSMGFNEKALEKLGMKIEDVPSNWSDFLDWLGNLDGAKLKEAGIQLVSMGYTDSDVRYEMLNMILQDYQYYVNATDSDLGYDNPLVLELLEKLEKIDFAALGCVTDDDDSVMMFEDMDDESALMQTSTGCSFGSFYGDYTPILMQIASDAPAYLVLDTTVVVINPFTKNPEAALAFVGEVADNLSDATLYCCNPDLSEPVRGKQNQAALDEMKESLDAMRQEYESAAAEEKQSLEQAIKDDEESYEYAEAHSWDVSPTEIEWYRAHDDNIMIGIYNWLYPDTASEEDESGMGQDAEAQYLMDQYLEGQINLKDMLSGIDKKVQMRRLEGN